MVRNANGECLCQGALTTAEIPEAEMAVPRWEPLMQARSDPLPSSYAAGLSFVGLRLSRSRCDALIRAWPPSGLGPTPRRLS